VLAGVEQVDDLGCEGNFPAAMFQIQAAPSPGMVNWRTCRAPRRMPSASTKSEASAPRRGSPPRSPPAPHRSPAPGRLPRPAVPPRPTPPRRAPRGAPFFPSRRRGTAIAVAGCGRRSRPGLADRLVHLHDLLRHRHEPPVVRDLAAHLVQLGGGQLPGARPAARRAGPQVPRPVPGMIRLRASAVRPAAAPPRLADAAGTEVAGPGQPRVQLCAASFQLVKRLLGHPGSLSGSFDTSRLPRQPGLTQHPYVCVAHPPQR